MHILDLAQFPLVHPPHSAKAVRTGALPGITRAVEGLVRVFDDPKTYLIDTPGVMVPNVKDSDVGMKLALVGSVKDDVVGIRVIAEYLLHTLNRLRCTVYVEMYGLGGPVEDIAVLLDAVAMRIGALRHQAKLDHQVAAFHFVKAFRMGKFGRFVLDDLTDEGVNQRKEQIQAARFWTPKQP